MSPPDSHCTPSLSGNVVVEENLDRICGGGGWHIYAKTEIHANEVEILGKFRISGLPSFRTQTLILL